MRPTKKSYRQSVQKVKSHFALCVQKLFTAEQLPKKFCKKAHRLAIDLVLIPYHGQRYTVVLIPITKVCGEKETVLGLASFDDA